MPCPRCFAVMADYLDSGWKKQFGVAFTLLPWIGVNMWAVRHNLLVTVCLWYSWRVQHCVKSRSHCLRIVLRSWDEWIPKLKSYFVDIFVPRSIVFSLLTVTLPQRIDIRTLSLCPCVACWVRRLADGNVHCGGSAIYQICFTLPNPDPKP